MAKKSKSKSPAEQVVHDQRMAARRTVIEELFNDYYDDRRNVYIMNFVRGIFFGLGSVIGATVVVALVVWIMSFFVQLPWVGDTIEQTQSELQSR